MNIPKRLLLVLATASILAVLFLPWMTVPSFNPHEHAVALMIPVVKSHSLPLLDNGTPQKYLFGTNPTTTPSVGGLTVEFPVEQYHAPKEKQLSPWDQFFASSFQTKAGYVDSGASSGETTTTCTVAYKAIGVTKSIRLSISVNAPDGSQIGYSAVKPLSLTAKQVTRVCTSPTGVQTTTSWYQYDEDVITTWTIGTFYFANGTGKYRIQTDLFDVTTAQGPAQWIKLDSEVRWADIPSTWTGK